MYGVFFFLAVICEKGRVRCICVLLFVICVCLFLTVCYVCKVWCFCFSLFVMCEKCTFRACVCVPLRSSFVNYVECCFSLFSICVCVCVCVYPLLYSYATLYHLILRRTLSERAGEMQDEYGAVLAELSGSQVCVWGGGGGGGELSGSQVR
jgi:hypothetical protein